MIDAADAYAAVQARVIALVSDPGTELTTPVPACPGWSVHDVLAHHVGVVCDVAGQSLPVEVTANLLEQWRDPEVQRARDAMTAAQVADRRTRSVPELCDEWRRATVVVTPWLRGEEEVPPTLPPFVPFVVVSDAVVHEGDIRGALGVGRAPDSDALALALAAYSFSLDGRIRTLGLPGLELVYGGKQRLLGDRPVAATVRADRHELVRVLAGRRDRTQILALDWAGDPSPFLDVLSEYGPVSAGTVD